MVWEEHLRKVIGDGCWLRTQIRIFCSPRTMGTNSVDVGVLEHVLYTSASVPTPGVEAHDPGGMWLPACSAGKFGFRGTQLSQLSALCCHLSQRGQAF